MKSADNPLGYKPFDAASHLTSDAMVAEFLSAALEEGKPEVILDAMNVAARARGMNNLARDTGLGRESLYKALRPGSQPRFETIVRVIAGLGMKFSVVPGEVVVAPLDAPTFAVVKASARRSAKPAETRKRASPTNAASKRRGRKTDVAGAPAARK